MDKKNILIELVRNVSGDYSKLLNTALSKLGVEQLEEMLLDLLLADKRSLVGIITQMQIGFKKEDDPYPAILKALGAVVKHFQEELSKKRRA